MVNLLKKKHVFFFSTRAAFSHFSSFSSTSKFCQNLVWGEMGINWRNPTNKWMHQKDGKQLQTAGFANSLTALTGRSSSFSKNQLRFKQPYQTASHSRSRGREANQSQQQVSRLLGAGSFFAFKIGELSEVVKQKKHFSSNKKSSKFQVPDFCEVHHLGTKVSSWAL